jgi:putative transposase
VAAPGGDPRPPVELDAELDRVQAEYNSVRLPAAMGYATRTTSTKAEAIRQARRDGLAQTRLNRIAYRRNTTPEANQ